ncbi:methyl-accepting chemotaxis protein [Parerythrobacter aestuarii]|uniref:methyl-accepting chemotaxis protein n=1 Tax=Parerythrobacter aestuarii TaxID=3020909 RepID=UPI0024DED329|nr:methyl-accepting chemotaxis protein [Parerythrobacter aestuarii]
MSAVEDLTRDWSQESGYRESDFAGASSEFERKRTLLERAYGSLSSDQKMGLTFVLPIALISAPAVVAILGMGEGAAGLSWSIGATALVSIAVMVVFGWVISREILGVTIGLAESLRRVSAGETGFVVPFRNRTDVYGEMANAIEVLRDKAHSLDVVTEEQQSMKAETGKIRENQIKQLLELADHFDRNVADVVSGVAAAASQLHSTASDMSRAAEQSTTRSEEVGKSMEEAAAGASAAAAASDEFAMSIGEISRQAADSAEMARKARGTAGEADETISALDQAASQIGQVVELISTIASRTNLLALNASIEAARGGEAGRGFAVVASEVKELASQTTRATEDVAAQIQAIQESTGASVKALRTVSTEIQQIESTAIAIASAVDQQSVAGQDLARSIDRAARNSESVGEHVREVRENSLLTGSAASQVLNSAGELEQQASTLRSQVDDFMKKIRESAKAG